VLQPLSCPLSVLPPLLVLIILVIFYKPVSDLAFAQSPSFPRQEIINPIGNWSVIKARQNLVDLQTAFNRTVTVELAKHKNECTEEKQNHFRIPDIAAVTYLSNGKTLNATLWLSNPLTEHPLNISTTLLPLKDVPIYMIRYGMAVDVISAYDTQGGDYAVRILWDAVNKTWTRVLEEYSPALDIRTLKQEDYHGGLPGIGKKYLDLSLNLSTLNYPDKYSLLFYVYYFFIKNGRLCSLTGEVINSSVSQSIPKSSNLTITVNPQLTLQEQISNVWTVIGSPVSGFYTLIAAAVGAVLSTWKILKNTRNKKLRNKYKKQFDNWD